MINEAIRVYKPDLNEVLIPKQDEEEIDDGDAYNDEDSNDDEE
jgi:hypothetical protein